MKILITGGSGDLGQIVIPKLVEDFEVINLDIIKPTRDQGSYVNGSILDRDLLMSIFKDVDYIVHIAAWHGIHEFRQEKTNFEFWDLNVTGTFNVFECAVKNKVKGIVNISSTSVDEWPNIYGFTKVINEKIADAFAQNQNFDVITLRPRAFIPYWNTQVYKNFVEWAQWFWGGAVHISDVEQAINKSLKLLISNSNIPSNLLLTIDGAYDYSPTILKSWDIDGTGSSFRKTYPKFEGIAIKYGFDISNKPRVLDISMAEKWIGYKPTYSLQNLLYELDRFGVDGPPL